MVVFTHVVVVGNLNVITTVIDVWWQYDCCTWFWVTCMCLSPIQYSSLYIPLVSKQMWQCSMFTTCPLYGGYVGCFPKMVAILLHHRKSIMVWYVAATRVFPKLLKRIQCCGSQWPFTLRAMNAYCSCSSAIPMFELFATSWCGTIMWCVQVQTCYKA